MASKRNRPLVALLLLVAFKVIFFETPWLYQEFNLFKKYSIKKYNGIFYSGPNYDTGDVMRFKNPKLKIIRSNKVELTHCTYFHMMCKYTIGLYIEQFYVRLLIDSSPKISNIQHVLDYKCLMIIQELSVFFVIIIKIKNTFHIMGHCEAILPSYTKYCM